MLKEHLSQDHDAASRRVFVIDEQIAWIHGRVLRGKPSRVLDLGCGPGLYTSRLARLGHTCVGIDFSPASLAYARATAADQDLPCTYLEADVRQAEYETGFDLVMLIYGELNVFRPGDARQILRKAANALATGGQLLLEPHTFEVVEREGKTAPSWYSAASGLFSDTPHIVLTENTWAAERAVATTRHYVIDGMTGSVTRHAQSVQAYTLDDYRDLLEGAGFIDIRVHPSLTGRPSEHTRDFIAVTASVV
jgi:SAM-dependent methyltransferase